MGTAPGKVIRSLRQALDMTQAEFARSAGWSVSTISSWERGTAKPSRLAFKTILAFAEERGVRYQPKGDGVPSSAVGPNSTATLPTLRLSSRLPSPPLVMLDAERPSSSLARGESLGSRRWTEIAAHGPVGGFEARATALAERPAWQVEARVQLRIGAGSERLRRTGYVAASVVALVIGLGVGALLRSGSAPDLGTTRIVAPVAASVPPVAASVPEVAPVPIDEITLAVPAVVPGPPFAAELPSALAEPLPVAARDMPASSLARLESIVVLDGIRRASFRVGDRSIALVEGDEIGGRAVVAIANDTVTLAGGGARTERVSLGFDTPLR